MLLNKPLFLVRLSIFHLTSSCWHLWSTLTRFRSQKGRRLWLELVLSALSTWRFTFVFLKMVFFCETKVVSKFKLVFFCETKVVSSHFGGIFFCREFQRLKIAVFWPKFTICWVSMKPLRVSPLFQLNQNSLCTWWFEYSYLSVSWNPTYGEFWPNLKIVI